MDCDKFMDLTVPSPSPNSCAWEANMTHDLYSTWGYPSLICLIIKPVCLVFIVVFSGGKKKLAFLFFFSYENKAILH